MMDKEKAYRDLFGDRKKCDLCQGPDDTNDRGLCNPAKIKGGVYDCEQIGHWSRWQGNLNAKLLVVGQDWGSVDYLCTTTGCESDTNPTNTALRHFLHTSGYDIPLPSKGKGGSGDVIFLTNAVLCLKRGKMNTPLRQSWVNTCGKHFMRRLIDIIQPEIVVSLGAYAYQQFRNLYNLPKMTLREAVDWKQGFALTNGARYFPMYHCSRIVRSYIRPIEQQEKDWRRIV